METTGRFYGAKRNLDNGKWLACFEVDSTDGMQELKEMDKLSIKAVKYREKRSLNANAYMWELIGKIAAAINSPSTDVYRQCLREVGVRNYLAVKKEAAADAIKLLTNIKAGGTGDFAELQMGGEAPKGYITIVHYIGSSRYDSKEMSTLIDYVVEMAQMLHIDTMTPEEISKLLEAGYGTK